jgi:hypothetical protein
LLLKKTYFEDEFIKDLVFEENSLESAKTISRIWIEKSDVGSVTAIIGILFFDFLQ